MATYKDLEPYVGRRIKFKCGKCRKRVLRELVCDPDPLGFDTAGRDGPPPLRDVAIGGWDLGNAVMAERVVGGPPVKRSRPAIGMEIAQETAGVGPGRETWACHPTCGARYTLLSETILARFLTAVRAGRTEVMLGKG